MLGLKLPTDPRWATAAQHHLEDLLTDHAYCEQKAASTAISLLVTYPEHTDLVREMAALAREEMSHFELVHQLIVQRGFVLGRERKDEYVAALQLHFPKTKDSNLRLIHRLLVAALIEARSCERFRVISETLEDEELARFYRGLMASEAGHYTLFLRLARETAGRDQVDPLWEGLLEYEKNVVATFERPQHIHG
jgi:tRNA-(ms[2]io[6]A)-hydroxylase